MPACTLMCMYVCLHIPWMYYFVLQKSLPDIDDHLLSHLHSVSKESISKIELVYGNAGKSTDPGKGWTVQGEGIARV